MRDKLRGTLEMTAAMVISGTIGWLVVLSGRPVTEVVFWRCLVGAAALLPVCVAMGLLKPGQVTRRQLLLAALGGLALVVNWLLLFGSYSRTSISIATAVFNTQPFMLVAMGTLFLRERLTLTTIGWLLLSFSGVLLIVSARPDAGGGGDYVVGVLMALGGAFLYAVAAFITKALKGVSPYLIALIQVTVGAALLWPYALNEAGAIAPASWAMLVTLGLVHTGLMYVLLYGAIQRLPTRLTGALSFIYPVVAFIVDALAFDRQPQLVQFLGATAILLAAAGIVLGWEWRRKRAVAVAAPVQPMTAGPDLSRPPC